jgi:hypothetical protein
MEVRVSNDDGCGYASLRAGGIHEYGDLEAIGGDHENVLKPLLK